MRMPADEQAELLTWITTGIFALSLLSSIFRSDPTLAICLFGFYGAPSQPVPILLSLGLNGGWSGGQARTCAGALRAQEATGCHESGAKRRAGSRLAWLASQQHGPR